MQHTATTLSSQLFSKAEAFLKQYAAEHHSVDIKERLEQINSEIVSAGTYTQTFDELSFGAKLAWRNSNRCIGRLFWKSLKVVDMRHLETEEAVFASLLHHLKYATNKGKIRSVITVFAPKHQITGDEFRIWNTHLIRYAGYQTPHGIIGDPAQLEFTKLCNAMGWKGEGTAFDILPIIIQKRKDPPKIFDLPKKYVLEVEIEHPEIHWFKELSLKWHAVPLISDMLLEIGGIHYSAAPFNGYYMVSEIASRNFADPFRYNVLPKMAEIHNIDLKKENSFWKDKALVELNVAVYESFKKAGISMVDHHTAAEQFMHFTALENKCGRQVTGDWAWLVPPISGSANAIYHQEWDNTIHTPNYFYNTPIWKKEENTAKAKCPFHI